MGQCSSKVAVSGDTILEAVASNDATKVQQILQATPSLLLSTQKVKPDQNAGGRGVWHVAAKHGHIEVMQAMRDVLQATIAEAVAAGLISLPNPKTISKVPSCDTEFSLDQAPSSACSSASSSTAPCSSKVPERFRKLVKLGHSGRAILAALVNQRDAQLQSPLHLAAMYGHAACVKLLLGLGADPWAADADCGRTPLHYAAAHGRADVIAVLLARPLPAAKSSQRVEPNTEKTKLVDVRCAHGFTPLHYAVWAGEVDAIRALASYDAFICARSLAEGDPWLEPAARGSTPLHLAALRGDLGTARALLAAHVHASSIPDLLPPPTRQSQQGTENIPQEQQQQPGTAMGSEMMLPQHQGGSGGSGDSGPSSYNSSSNNRPSCCCDRDSVHWANDDQRRRRMEPRQQADWQHQTPLELARKHQAAAANADGKTDGPGDGSSGSSADLATLLELLHPDMPLSFLLEPQDLDVGAVRMFGPPRLAIIAAEALHCKLMGQIQIQEDKVNLTRIQDPQAAQIQVMPQEVARDAGAAGEAAAVVMDASPPQQPHQSGSSAVVKMLDQDAASCAAATAATARAEPSRQGQEQQDNDAEEETPFASAQQHAQTAKVLSPPRAPSPELQLPPLHASTSPVRLPAVKPVALFNSYGSSLLQPMASICETKEVRGSPLSPHRLPPPPAGGPGKALSEGLPGARNGRPVVTAASFSGPFTASSSSRCHSAGYVASQGAGPASLVLGSGGLGVSRSRSGQSCRISRLRLAGVASPAALAAALSGGGLEAPADLARAMLSSLPDVTLLRRRSGASSVLPGRNSGGGGTSCRDAAADATAEGKDVCAAAAGPDAVCGICMEGAEGGVILLAADPCGHELCTGCAAEMCRMHRVQPARCPFCRNPIGDFKPFPPAAALGNQHH